MSIIYVLGMLLGGASNESMIAGKIAEKGLTKQQIEEIEQERKRKQKGIFYILI